VQCADSCLAISRRNLSGSILTDSGRQVAHRLLGHGAGGGGWPEMTLHELDARFWVFVRVVGIGKVRVRLRHLDRYRQMPAAVPNHPLGGSAVVFYDGQRRLRPCFGFGLRFGLAAISAAVGGAGRQSRQS